MEMNQVRYFLALCNELNFTRAAKRCGVAQPSLTNAIKALEAELRGALFYRSPVVRLTVLGEAIRPSLANIVFYLEEAKRRAARRHARYHRKRITPDNQWPDREIARPCNRAAGRARIVR